MITITFKEGLLVHKQVKVGETPPLMKDSRNSTLENRAYVLPRDKDAFMRCVSNNMDLFIVTPGTTVKTKWNLNLLRNVFKDEDEDEWLEAIYMPQIRMNSDKNYELNLFYLGNFMDDFAPQSRLTGIIDEEILKVSTIINNIEYSEEESRVKSLELFRGTNNSHKSNVLTDVKLDHKMSGEIANLGVAVNVWEIANKSDQRVDKVSLTIHGIILKTLMNTNLVKVNHRGVVEVSKISKNIIKKGIADMYPCVPQIMMEIEKCKSEEITEATNYAKLEKIIGGLKGGPLKGGAPNAIATWLYAALIPDRDMVQVLANVDKLEKSEKEVSKSGKKMGLDEWQKKVIYYVEGGKSIIVNAPTTSGKTFVAMSTINNLLIGKGKKTICYVAPSFDLALQTYANIKKTFPLKKIALITGRVSHIPENVDVWVGTPTHLLIYFMSQGVEIEGGKTTPSIKIDTLFIDEIHSISTTFGVGEEARLRSEAIARLTRIGQSQIVCLSATLTHSDIYELSKMISESPLNSCNIYVNKDDPYDPKNDTVVETKRTVEQRNFEWDGENFISHKEGRRSRAPSFHDDGEDERKGRRSRASSFHEGFLELPTADNDVGDSELYVCRNVTPSETFKFIKRIDRKQFIPGTKELREREGENTETSQVPALVFDESPGICYTNFVELVGWLKKMEAKNYEVSHGLGHIFNSDIYLINAAINRTNPTEVAKIVENREKLREHALKIGVAIQETIQHIMEFRSSHINIQSDSKAMGVVNKVVTDYLSEYNIKYDPSNIYVPVEIWDMIATHDRVIEESSKGRLSPIFVDVGSYYRVGKKCEEIESLKAMFEPSLRSDGEALKNRMLSFCEAERIDSRDVKRLFDLMVDGLNFGVGIILPVLPFIIHFSTLKLLKNRSDFVVFSSYDVSMGINYPIRTVCIRSNTPKEMNVSEYLQMAGRSGRRGRDYCGMVISWNIKNAGVATQDHLSRIIFPDISDPEKATGCLIKSPITLAVTIDVARSFTLDAGNSIEHLSEAISKLGYTGKKEDKSSRSKTKMDRGGGINDYKDDEGFDAEEEDRIIRAKKAKEEKKKKIAQSESIREDHALSSALGSCIFPLAKTINLEDEEIFEIVNRIQNITMGVIKDDMKVDKYFWAEKIGICKKALQELHTRMSNTSYSVWLGYIESVYEVIHRTQFRQMQLV